MGSDGCDCKGSKLMTKKEIRKWVVDNIARLNCYPLGDIVNDPKAWDKSQQNKGGIIILTRLLKELDKGAN
jgi:hypothetical protein